MKRGDKVFAAGHPSPAGREGLAPWRSRDGSSGAVHLPTLFRSGTSFGYLSVWASIGGPSSSRRFSSSWPPARRPTARRTADALDLGVARRTTRSRTRLLRRRAGRPRLYWGCSLSPPRLDACSSSSRADRCDRPVQHRDDVAEKALLRRTSDPMAAGTLAGIVPAHPSGSSAPADGRPARADDPPVLPDDLDDPVRRSRTLTSSGGGLPGSSSRSRCSSPSWPSTRRWCGALHYAHVRDLWSTDEADRFDAAEGVTKRPSRKP